MAKKTLKEVLNPKKKVHVQDEVAKWVSAGYTHSGDYDNTEVLTKQKGKITHETTIHHDGTHVTHNTVRTIGPKSALSNEQKRDAQEADGVVSKIKKKMH